MSHPCRTLHRYNDADGDRHNNRTVCRGQPHGMSYMYSPCAQQGNQQPPRWCCQTCTQPRRLILLLLRPPPLTLSSLALPPLAVWPLAN
jgi:hypothetical protein